MKRRWIPGAAAVLMLGTCVKLSAQKADLATSAAQAQVRLADSTIARSDDGRWSLGEGVLLEGLDSAWHQTADPKYFNYVKAQVDKLVNKEGEISTPKEMPGAEAALLGRELMLLHGATQDMRYFKAASALRQQYTGSDALQGSPFLAEYASQFQSPQDLHAIVARLKSGETHISSTKGDASRARDTAFYLAAVVDTLDYLPASLLGRTELIATLNRTANALAATQNAKTGLWNSNLRQRGSVDLPASAMLIYALEKSMRRGYLSARFQGTGEKGYGALAREPAGNDALLNGAYLLADAEESMTKTATMGRGKTVMVDAWFNSQTRKNAAGQTESYHYKWGDEASSGFSFLQYAYQSYGVRTDTLYAAPTVESLKHAQIYMIVSPDIESKNPNPHFMRPQDAGAIVAWVKQGGVLVMMENDGNDAEFDHVNQLMDQFGIHFNPVDNNQVPGRDFDKGKLLIPAGNAIFTPKKIYMKEIASITTSAPARSLLEWEGNCVMAETRYGRGTVYAVVDPWLYNEYTDSRRIPMDFENYGAAKQLVRWLLLQIPR